MFSIVHPALFGIGLACIAIPIIIHLLRRKRKPISWGAMRFLEQAYRKRKRILTIEQLILLATRCALVALLAIGIGGVLLGSSTNTHAPVSLTIVLDNAIGAAITDTNNKSALDRSKQAALNAIDQLNPARGDRASLITLGSPASAPIMHSSTDLDAVRALIAEIHPTDTAADYTGMLELVGAQDTPEESATIQSLLIASSFRGFTQSTIEQSTGLKRFTRIQVPLPDGEPISNIALTAIIPSRALRLDESATTLPLTLHISLLRSGPRIATTSAITITDAKSGIIIAEGLYRWNSTDDRGSLVVPVRADALSTLRAGSAAIIATIAADANTRDNTIACIIRLRKTIRVGVIDADRTESTSRTIRGSSALRAALAPNDRSPIEMVFLDTTRISTPKLASLDAVFVLAPNTLADDTWNTLAIANRAGLVVIIAPDADAPTARWTNELTRLGVDSPPETLIPIAHEPPISLSETLDGSSLLGALVAEYAPLARSVHLSRSIDLGGFTNARTIASSTDDSPFIVDLAAQHTGQGSLIVLASAIDLNWTDLPARPLFV
ncbi:MAG: BatA domain-containing protein, partial [Phycisphaerales bacterium]|nr:BatA domain-containing protein [Phycisphaerales bacterium]